MPAFDDVTLGEVYRQVRTMHEDLVDFKKDVQSDQKLRETRDQQTMLKVGEVQLRVAGAERGVDELWREHRETKKAIELGDNMVRAEIRQDLREYQDATKATTDALDRAVQKLLVNSAAISGAIGVLAWLIPLVWKQVISGGVKLP